MEIMQTDISLWTILKKMSITEDMNALFEYCQTYHDFLDRYNDWNRNQFEVGDIVKTDVGDKAIIIAKSFEPSDLYGKQPYYDLLFKDGVVENERASVLTKVGKSGIDELNKLFKLLE